jgi:hypothetical protein
VVDGEFDSLGSHQKIIMHFIIDPSYLCSVTIRESGSIFAGKKKLTDEELIRVLKGTDRWESIRDDDHPEFKKLRNQLEAEGFIKTERSWWNGDYVLKEFTVNGAIFKKDEKFYSGAAIKWTVDRKLKDQKEMGS